MEQSVQIGLLLGGLAVVALGWLGLVVQGFRQSLGWGLLCLVPPLFVFFILLRFRKARVPALVMLLGAAAIVVPVAWNHLVPPDLGPREAQVNGDLEITLTGWDSSDPTGWSGLGRRFSRWVNRSVSGWDRRDYSVLRTKPDVVYLQMANGDVTDETLEYLKGLKKLRRLDLSDTQITNAGLHALEELPELETLWLKRTAITDDGVRAHLLSIKSLKRLDVTKTHVSAAARKEWRQAQPGRVTIPR